MKIMMVVLAALAWQAATPAAPRSWSGFLVNSDCYESRVHNTDPWDTSTYVDRDKDADVRNCSPNAKTKYFEFVDRDGVNFRLDAAGNAKAEEVVRNNGKQKYLEVTITGEPSKQTIQVESITAKK
jgi:hypothetical protein